MYQNLEHVVSQLPPEFQDELMPSIRNEFDQGKKTIVVLDDDPTGTQTCHDVVVLTSWSVDLISAELKKKPSILFILTNSRSLPEQAAVQLTLDIGTNLKEAVTVSGRAIAAISRSDSTLRGHFPAEVYALAKSLGLQDSVVILVPAFIEGARITLDDVHYIVEQQQLIPVADTPFAQDNVFGYTHSNMREWVEEKTRGQTKAIDVMSISLEDLRLGGPSLVSEKLVNFSDGKVCVVNALSYKDLEVFTMGLLMAEKAGKTFLFRSSASFVPVRAGIVAGKIITPDKEEVSPKHGSLVIVGSHVPKTTLQLNHLLKQGTHLALEVNVAQLLGSSDLSSYVDSFIKQADQFLSVGKDVVIFTSRKLEKGTDADSSLEINRVVSTFLVNIVKGLSIRPSFIVSKGGITSSDIASDGLSAAKALVLGQAAPGVPVWKLGLESKFPKILYIVFPGNVGGETALTEVCKRFKFNS